MKLCISCKITKELADFAKNKASKDGLQTYCKLCSRAQNRNSYHKNSKDKKKAYRRKQYLENKEKNNLQSKMWLLNNPLRAKENAKLHYQKNKKEINLKRKIRAQNNSRVRIDAGMRCTIRTTLLGKKAGRSWKDLVGYSLDDLISHLESRFTKGMTWENYGAGGWEIDHIIPKYYFKYTSAECQSFKVCWALSNLQPLWATTEIALSYGEDIGYIGNRDKNNKITLTDEIKKIIDSANNT